MFAPTSSDGISLCMTTSISTDEQCLCSQPQIAAHSTESQKCYSCITDCGMTTIVKGNHCFVSGTDEKVARVFKAPLSFLKTLSNATLQKSCYSDDDSTNIQILGANMSAPVIRMQGELVVKISYSSWSVIGWIQGED
ncbi:hypothetical protein TSUD_49810 [Trifolium subterraneum]|uniref:Uncharacterized protein n=1 Tax=Trifolium subterraneum TaxID=3900 RepID=A0A2Z6N2M7_TRISU|nr:hypothetical protein TSUD_49810 [Trifolium subterraneum]